MSQRFVTQLQICSAETSQPVTEQFVAPVLLHGTRESGLMPFVAALVQHAIDQEQPVLVLSLRREDIRALQDQLQLSAPATSGHQVTEETMDAADQHLLTTLTFQRPEELQSAVRSLPHWTDRLVIVLGGEQTLRPGFLTILLGAPMFVVAGNFSAPLDFLNPETFATKIGFAAWPKSWHLHRPHLPAYIGCEASTKQQFIVLPRQSVTS